MKKTALSLLILLLLLGCGGKPELPQDHLTWTWEEDQTCAGGENIWGGFVETQEGYRARKTISAFALWRKTPPRKITLVYKNRGKFPVKLTVNGAEVTSLPPSSTFRKITVSSPLLQRGLNIVGFIRRKNREFVVKKLCFSEGRGKNFVLERNEVLFIPSEGGTLSFKLSGRGRARVVVHGGRDFQEEKVSAVKCPVGFFPRKFEFTEGEPFLLEIRVEKGSFKLMDFSRKVSERNPAPLPRRLFRKPYPDIYIFLIDACQASHLSLYGYPRKTSPNIDRLGEESLVFENAYTTASFTRAAVASIFSGFFPDHHKVRVLRAALDPRLLLLPEFLKARRYTTSIFTASANVSASFGFSQGIDEFFGYYGRWSNKTSGKMAEDFLNWIFRRPSPKFSYIHFMEPHFPIIPPPPFKNMFKKRPSKKPVLKSLRLKKDFTPEEVQDVVDDYDSAIAYIDSVLGKIWDRMRRRGSFKNSMIFFLSDHGEALYEHGAFGHGAVVYEEMTHIPLVVKFPSYMGIKGRVKALVQPTDIFPTVASLFGVNLPLDGRSLLEAKARREVGNEIAVVRNFLNPGAYGLRWRNYYYIIDMNGFKEKLFKIQGHPQRSYTYKNPLLTLYLRGRFFRWLKKYQNLSLTGRKLSLKKLSHRELENLRSLGYIK